MAYVRLNDNNYIAISDDRVIEVVARSKEEALLKAKSYFKCRTGKPVQVAKVPAIISVLD